MSIESAKSQEKYLQSVLVLYKVETRRPEEVRLLDNCFEGVGSQRNSVKELIAEVKGVPTHHLLVSGAESPETVTTFVERFRN